MIEIRDLHKTFGNQPVLDGVDLDIETGNSIVILGRSGSGKSVLLKHIIGLMKPDRGTISVDGQEVTSMSYAKLAEMRKRFGMLFQQAALFDSMTVGENVGLALREHTSLSAAKIAEIVADKLAHVNLFDLQDKKPSDLSGGMRKRVGLARAIAMDPDYILYDEPTTGLDPVTAQQINELIRDLQSKLNVTSIVVTHDLQSAYHVGDRLCLLYQGKIYFDGTPEEIQNSADPVVHQFITASAEGPLTADPEERAHLGPAGAKFR
jgi:phospholipid/cholesterol/gamma-HCH transport system ATP-binding protein